jgi:hypothetical protein
MEDEILDFDHLEQTYDIEPQQIVSLNKFIFLSIISFGTYEIWWIYKAWRFFQQKEKSDIMPAARAIFSIFYLHSLMEKTLNLANKKGYNESYSSTSQFVGFIIANLLSRLPDPYWLISFGSIFFLIPPFKAFNFALQQSTNIKVIEHDSFSGRQIVLILIGVIFWGLVLYGFSEG